MAVLTKIKITNVGHVHYHHKYTDVLTIINPIEEGCQIARISGKESTQDESNPDIRSCCEMNRMHKVSETNFLLENDIKMYFGNSGSEGAMRRKVYPNVWEG